ncbi:MAG: DL-endopeptidase inhibitor IseA family protein [Clostridium sp.]
MGRKLVTRKFFMITLMLIVIGLGSISAIDVQKTTFAATKGEMDKEDILKFIKEGYNAYWYLDESLDMDMSIKYKGLDYLRVKKNFYSKGDLYRYFSKFYTQDSTKKFIDRLSPRIIDGELYVTAGEAGDKPYMDSGEIVDINKKNGYVTIMFRDKNDEDIYIKVYIKFEDEKLKIDKFEAL